MKALMLIPAILLMAWTGYAQNGAEQTFDWEIEGLQYNECCNEMVYMQGTAHFVLRKNGYHFDVRSVIGTTESGNTYTQRGVSIQNGSNGKDGNPATVTYTIKLVNEDGCSFSVTYVGHITWTEGAETPTVYFEKTKVTCDE